MNDTAVVNENDEIIGAKSRSSVDGQRDIFRVAALWVVNSRGEVLVAQRSFQKSNSPGLWGPSVAGTVEPDETYASNIVKEAAEEIGLTDFEPVEIAKIRIFKPRNYFCQWYFTQFDWPIDKFKPSEAELENLKWVKIDQLALDVVANPSAYLANFGDSVKLLIDFLSRK
ncbi:MAG: NUDIX domain-containing protein [Candidatus Nomurabacteria bacterium]|jgi:isopentenyldiphosphate isomerase|nr:NUDIX domain-containing protein [Candidatus Nomurabacteria bacterium]